MLPLDSVYAYFMFKMRWSFWDGPNLSLLREKCGAQKDLPKIGGVPDHWVRKIYTQGCVSC